MFNKIAKIAAGLGIAAGINTASADNIKEVVDTSKSYKDATQKVLLNPSNNALEMSLSDTNSNIQISVGNDKYSIAGEYGNSYFETSMNDEKNKEIGLGGAYSFDSGLVVGAKIAKKDNIGDQYGFGAGTVKTTSDSSYIGGAVKGTMFDSKEGYQDSKSVEGKAFVGAKPHNDFSLELGVGGKYTNYDQSKSEKTAEGSLGITYYSDSYSVGVKGTIDKNNEKVLATLNIPLNGKVNKNINSISKTSLKTYLADSSFDNSMVKKNINNTINNINAGDTEAPQLTSTSSSINNGFLDSNISKDYSSIVSDNVTVDANLTIELVSSNPELSVTNTGANVTFERIDGGNGNSIVEFRFVDQAGNKSGVYTEVVNGLNNAF